MQELIQSEDICGRLVAGLSRVRRSVCAVCLLLVVGGGIAQAAGAGTVHTDALNRDPLVQEAYQHFYELDYDGAQSRYEKVAQEHANDPIVWAYLLNVVLFRELLRQDLLDTTQYVNDGFLTGKHPVVEDKQITAKVEELSEKAVRLANDRLKTNPNDTDALYARGFARSLRATYMGMVQRSFIGGLRWALDARHDHEKVLQIDPEYVDGKMVVGIHDYVVGALPFAFKIMAGVAGIHGDKAKGMALLKDASNRGVITSVESRTAMALFLRREAKYQEAITVTHTLKEQYPRDFLFRLEEANLTKDAGDGQKAIAMYRSALSEAQKPGYFYQAHLELAYLGLGETLRGQKNYGEAASAYEQAAKQPTASADLRRKAELGAGQMYDLLQQRDKARQQYTAVVASGSGSMQADMAKRLLQSPYSGN